jgi:hypothetical protein
MSPGVLNPSCVNQSKLGIFHDREPADLVSLDSILLMLLKVNLTWGRKVTKSGFSLDGTALSRGLIS